MRHLFLAAAVLSTAAFAQSEYFPLQTGNTWVYRLTGPRIQPPIAGTQMFVMSVGEPIAVDGVEYWNVDGVPGVGNAKLRYSDSGRLVAFDEESKSEKVWLSFSAGLGEEFESHVHQCVSSAQVRARDGKETLPVGTLENLLKVQYGSFTCADAGTTEDAFMANVGLVKRVETSFVGPRTYELVYARVGDSIVLSQPEQSFTVAIDKHSFEAGKPVEIQARLSLRNTTATPIALFFSSGQRFNFSITNEKGDSVYNWAATRLFPAVTDTVQVRGEKVWFDTFVAADSLPPGRYMLEGSLTSTPIRYRAFVAFDVK